MNTMTKLIAAGALTAMTAACAARQAAEEGAAAGETGRETTIEVQNQNFYDARIYLVKLGTRTRLGTVPSNTTKVFPISVGMTEIRIFVDFIGSGEFTTNSMAFNLGEELLLIVTANAHQLRTRR